MFGCSGSSLLLRFSLVVVSGDHSLVVVVCSLWWPLSWPGALEHGNSIVGAHRLSSSAACGIFPDQASNHVSCIGRQILYRGATREALNCMFYSHVYRIYFTV